MIRELLFISTVAFSATAFAQPKGGTPAQPAQPKAAEPAKDVAGPKDAVNFKPAELKWSPGPPSLPPGAEIVILSGDPKVEGPFTMRLRLPAKYKLPNHWHPAHEHVTVIEGTFFLGHGDTFDVKTMKELPVGSFAMMPPKHSHYAMTKKKTVIQVHAWGPWSINYINPADDPRNKPAAATTPTGTTPAGTTPATPAKPATK